MPIVDMPLEELKRYKGLNPRPADMDAYWERALQEMHALGTGCELMPAKFQAPGVKCYDLYFVGVGGSKIHGRAVIPEKDGKMPAVIQFHGYSGSGANFVSLLSYAAAGFVSVSMDVRGQGGLSEDLSAVRGTTFKGQIVRGLSDPNPDKLAFRNIFLDTAQLARIVMDMPMVDETRVGCLGGSQGGGLSLACAALEPKINRTAPSMPFLCDYKRVWVMDLAVGAYEELSYYFRNFDPLHEREDEIFEKLGYIDNQHLAPRIRGKVLMITGLMDTICPASTQFAAYNKIQSPKQVKVFPDFAHEACPGESELVMQFMLEM